VSERSEKPTEASKHPLRRLGSYTTARVCHGRVERVERHVARLRRDAQRLGLAPPAPRDVEALFREVAEAKFPSADGIIRIEWSAPPGSPPALTAQSRELGDLPPRWRARSSETIHPGPGARRNTKAVEVAAYDASREEMKRLGVEEVLLFDADRHLVEGCRSNILIVRSEGALVTPDLAFGCVEGLGLSIVKESRSDLQFARVDKEALADAREIMAVNAVRGVVPIIELDRRPVGSGHAGPVALALGNLFRRIAVA
jgi:branched-subunit amino acid aminotransferase/4-amino-4-deoxychorismate lyase